MIKFLLALFVIVFCSSAFACEIQLPQNIVILGESANFSSALNSKNCSEETLKEVNLTLNSVEGKITSFQFAEILKAKNFSANIQPSLIQVQQLKHLIKEQILLPTGVQLTSSQALYGPNFLTLNANDKVSVECIGCLFGSEQPVNINILGFDGSHRSIVIKANFKKMVRAYKLIMSAPAFAEISADMLKEEYVESIPHTDLITDIQTLRFYKINKPLRAGELLKKSDLNAVNLVRAGMKTDVIIENSLVKLKTEGISRNNGSLGELVEVFHPQKNKKYLGRVIDINKVLVDL